MIQRDSDHPLTGGCQCGAIRYALTAPPERVHLCHCRMCQKAVGGQFAGSAPVRRADFPCDTTLTFYYNEADRIAVTLSVLDRPLDVPPVRHYGIEGRLGWLDRIGTLPVETTG
jgi:hypothetical protein